jgi:iron complex transport system substrate-binding protein
VKLVALACLLAAACGGKRAEPAGGDRRIVAIGGSVTEIVYALGAGGDVVGADLASVYPPDADEVPKIGYSRTLTAEPIAALEPTLVVASDEIGPPATVQQLRDLGLPLTIVPSGPTVEAARTRIAAVATAIDADATALLAAFDTDVAAARAAAARTPRMVRAVAVYARGAGTVMVGGRDTASGAILDLAGAENAAAGSTGYAPWTAEAIVDAAPEVIVIPTRSLAALGGEAALWALPGVAQTPAGAAKRVIVIDDLLLLGFGPRLGEAIRALSAALAPIAAAPAAAGPPA